MLRIQFKDFEEFLAFVNSLRHLDDGALRGLAQKLNKGTDSLKRAILEAKKQTITPTDPTVTPPPGESD